MKKTSHIFLFGALVLVLLLAGCAGEEVTPTPISTLPGGEEMTSTPSAAETDTTGTAETEVATTGTAETTAEATQETTTATADGTQQATPSDTTQTPGIPVTGTDIILLECQFCIDTMAHALLVMPATSTFELVTSSASTATADTGCSTVDTYNDKQVVLCRAEEDTSLTLDICTAGTCSQLTVALQTCPQAATGTTPANATDTPGAGTATGTPTAEASPTTGAVTSTPTP